MNVSKYICWLFLLILGFPVDAQVDRNQYNEFKIVPDYILNPDEEQKEYFAAYDKTLEHWGVPYEELYIYTSKGIAHVLLSGPQDGTPIVLLHGMGGSSTLWYSHAKVLAQKYRLFAIDLIIEPGKSYKTADIKNIDQISSWYNEIFKALKLDSFYVMGPSRGGWLAVNLALHTEREIRGLVLMSPVQTFIWVPPSLAILKNTFNIFYSKEKSIARTMATLSNDTSKINADYLRQYTIGREHDTLNKFIGQMKPFCRGELQSLQMPVLVLVGEDDILNNVRSIKRARRLLPHFSGTIISDSGHFLSVDKPEVVNREVLQFLERAEAGYYSEF